MHSCFAVNSTEADLRPRYWLFATWREGGQDALSLGLTRIGRCLPDACKGEDLSAAVGVFLAGIGKNFTNFTARILDNHSPDDEVTFSAGDIVMLAVVTVMGVLVVVSTLLDLMATEMEMSYFVVPGLGIVQGFSLYSNIIKLFHVAAEEGGGGGEGNLACIHGIRAISISWVVLGHVFFEMSNLGLGTGNGILINNIGVLSEPGGPIDRRALTAVWNGMFCVDTFFLIGATLMSFLLLKELDKRKGGNAMMWVQMYVHRYIRLSSIYAVVIGLQATLLGHLAVGPLSFLVDKQVEKCQNGWYLNLLYINNFAEYLGDNNKCMAWTWYMANDMQFFIITPLIVYTLWRSRLAGLILGLVLLAASTATPFVLTWQDEDQFFHGDIETFYTKPWNRFQPYLFGLALGYLLHQLRHVERLALPTVMNLWIWMVAAATALTTVYGVSDYNLILDPALRNGDNWPTREERSVYNGFSKIAWSLSIGWVILACVKGRGGPVNAFLSWTGWVPVARLSFCIYLVQYTVIYVYNSMGDTLVAYSHLSMAYMAIAHFMVCCGVALVLVLLFEAPLTHMEKLLFASLGMGKMPQARKTGQQRKSS
jgi:peptidoglycan/LPS O-acetylase OafA/YrhL